MKTWLLASVSLIAFGYSCSANAADASIYMDSVQPSAIVQSNNQIILEFVGPYLDYLEKGGDYGTPTGKLDSERGFVPGFGLKASLMNDWFFGNDYFEAEFSQSSGSTHYIGAFIGGGPYGSVKTNNGATFTDLNFRYGKGFAIQSDFMITPFAEAGYHKWVRKVNLGETYTNNYVGGGVLLQYSPFDSVVLSANAMVGETFSSHINVAGSFGFSAALGNSLVYKLGVSGDYAVTSYMHASLGVEYSSFKYGASALQPSFFYEPHSTSNVATVKAGIGFTF